MRTAGAASELPPTRWGWIMLLYSPVLVYYASHYAVALLHPGIIPTGFTQYDLPYSMACAREFADNGLHGLLFTLPSNAEAVGEPVLLQLHLWALGQVWRVFAIDPGLLYVCFGMVMGLLAVRAFTRLFDVLVPTAPTTRPWGQVLFLWGGGLLALSGQAMNILQERPVEDWWLHLLDLDPAHGWWMMNLGRCLILPNEAYYHLLFYTAAWTFVRRKHASAVLCLLLLAASHPFAGVGGLVVFLSWSLLERLVHGSRAMPTAVPLMLAATGSLCCWYYFIWLPPRLDPQLVRELPSAYIIEARSILPAYVLVLVPACARLRTLHRLRDFLSDRTGRLLLIIVAVQFALENHELFIRPFQPAHFTRGYTWAALFLIGAPWLLNEAWPEVRARWPNARHLFTVPVVALLLSDNTAFFALNIKRQFRASQPGFWLTTEQRAVLQFLNTLPSDGPLVICQDETLAYMTIVYTPMRAYRSHFFGEKDAWSRVKQQSDYFQGRVSDPVLAGSMIAVADKSVGTPHIPGPSALLFENGRYAVFRSTGS